MTAPRTALLLPMPPPQAKGDESSKGVAAPRGPHTHAGGGTPWLPGCCSLSPPSRGLPRPRPAPPPVAAAVAMAAETAIGGRTSSRPSPARNSAAPSAAASPASSAHRYCASPRLAFHSILTWDADHDSVYLVCSQLNRP